MHAHISTVEGGALPCPKTSFEGNENAEYGAWQMSRQTGRREACLLLVSLFFCLKLFLLQHFCYIGLFVALQMSRQTGRQEAAIRCIGLYGCLFAANFLCRICLLHFLFLPLNCMWKTSRQAESGNLLVCCIGLYDCMFIA